MSTVIQNEHDIWLELRFAHEEHKPLPGLCWTQNNLCPTT
uniref:Uncharacterized protein n=1 Tax=Anguilla anguilla TaxID=7936 RepID=A0A0E9S2L1_ANGAN